MADVNFFSRLTNLWKGFISLWVEDIEKNHPEIAYENAVRSMTEKYIKLKKATAAIIRRREELQQRFEEEQKSLAQVTSDLSAAMDTDQDDVAVILIQKKNAVEAELAELTESLNLAKTDAEDAKASLMSVKGEIDKLKAEKDRMLAKMASAQARVKIQEQIEGLSVDAEVQALDSVRGHIKTTVAEANLGKELAENDLDNKLKQIRREGAKSSARAELERMKAARAQAQAKKM